MNRNPSPAPFTEESILPKQWLSRWIRLIVNDVLKQPANEPNFWCGIGKSYLPLCKRKRAISAKLPSGAIQGDNVFTERNVGNFEVPESSVGINVFDKFLSWTSQNDGQLAGMIDGG